MRSFTVVEEKIVLQPVLQLMHRVILVEKDVLISDVMLMEARMRYSKRPGKGSKPMKNAQEGRFDDLPD